MRIRVITRAALFEECKRQHIERGYRIEDERPIPVNDLCSFIAVREIPASDPVGELVAQADPDDKQASQKRSARAAHGSRRTDHTQGPPDLGRRSL